MKLLTRNNPKTAKGEKNGIATAILHLAPHKLSGANVCPHATVGCAAACLNTAGRGGIGLDENGLNTIQNARIARTRMFRNERETFLAQLGREIRAFLKWCDKKGFTPAIRLNGTSDIPWEKIAFEGHDNVMLAFPNVQFYDYTKWPIRLRGTLPANYHLTFSLAEGNDKNAIAALEAGINVAAVFRIPRSADTPSRYRFGGKVWPVIDGDETDVRFGDTGGAIIALRAKGRAKSDTSGFVRDL